LIIEKRYQQLVEKLHLLSADLFKGEETLINEIVTNKTKHRLKLDEEKFQIQQAYFSIKKLVKEIDVTLEQHAEALETQSIKKLSALEKKMLRAEKRKFEDQKKQLSKIFPALFPQRDLQERTENFMLLYSKWGNNFFDILYKYSLTLEQEFCMIEER
jgi:uncharacterized protein YllA (UPF0747 family)